MDELVKLVTDKVGISPDQGQKAVTIVLGFLKDRLPAPLGEELDKVVAGGAGGSGGIGGMAGAAESALGGMFDKK
jgi:hypothetical protein